MEVRPFSEAQWKIIHQINAILGQPGWRTPDEDRLIILLLHSLIRISQPPLDNERAWLNGPGKGILHVSYAAYKHKKERCNLTQVM